MYCCFLLARKRKNLDNVLLDEGINLISEKLDVLNLFDKVYKVGQTLDKIEDNDIFEVCQKSAKLIYYLLIATINKI